MTRKVFWEDPYRTAIDTRVATVTGGELTLDATILYALAGGQESDHGTIAGRPVQAARWTGHEIVYALAPDHGLMAGDAVRVVLDWTRRYALMRLHFAAELVLEIAMQRLAGAAKIGAHIAADKARIDFAWTGVVTPLLPDIAAAAQAIVDRDLAIESAFSDEAAERRYWRVPGFAQVPCGGTHLRRTGEVGTITLKRRNVGKGKERIEITVS